MPQGPLNPRNAGYARDRDALEAQFDDPEIQTPFQGYASRSPEQLAQERPAPRPKSVFNLARQTSPLTALKGFGQSIAAAIFPEGTPNLYNFHPQVTAKGPAARVGEFAGAFASPLPAPQSTGEAAFGLTSVLLGGPEGANAIKSAATAIGQARQGVQAGLRNQGLGDALYNAINAENKVRGGVGAAGPFPQAYSPPAKLADAFNAHDILTELRPGEEKWNMARQFVNDVSQGTRAVLDDPVVQPWVRFNRDMTQKYTSVANQLGQRVDAALSGPASPFRLGHQGVSGEFIQDGLAYDLAHIVPKVGAPDIADIAARYPLYEPHLTAPQKHFMEELRREVTKYADVLKEAEGPGAIGQRKDIMGSPSAGKDAFLKRYLELSKKVAQAEKTPGRAMSPEEVALWNKDWVEFSKQRGYSDAEIADFKTYLNMAEQGKQFGLSMSDLHAFDVFGPPEPMQGGFYVPRGKATVEGFDQAAPLSGARRAGGKPGSERTAKLASAGEGVQLGYSYTPVGERITSFVNEVGRRATQVAGNEYLKNAVDPFTGAKAARTAADRLDQGLVADVGRLRNRIRARTASLIRQNVRTGIYGDTATQTNRVLRNLETQVVGAEGRLNARQAANAGVTPRAFQRDVLDAVQQARDISTEMGRNAELLKQANRTLSATEQAALNRAAQMAKTADELERLAANQLESPSLAASVHKSIQDAEGRAQAALFNKLPGLNNQIDQLTLDAEHFQNQVTSLIDAGKLYKGESAEARSAIATGLRKSNMADTQNRLIYGAKRELSALEREINRVKNAGGDIGRKATSADATLSRMEAEYDALRTQLGDLQGDLNVARARAQSPSLSEGPRSRILNIGLDAYDFPTAMANAANKTLRESQLEPGLLREVSALYTGLRATGDNSYLGIQALLGASSRILTRDGPGSLARLMKVNAQAFFDPQVLGKAFNAENQRAARQGLLTSEAWAKSGVHFGAGVEEMTLTGKGGVAGFVGNLPGLKQSNRAFGATGDFWRMRWANDLLATELRKGKTLAQVYNSGDIERIASIVNKATGYSSQGFGGDVGKLLLFAPRYFQSRLETLAAVGRGGLEGRVARDAFMRLIGEATTATIAINALNGEETDLNPLMKDTKGEWTWNPNFLRIRWNDKDFSLLGPWDSLARLGVLSGVAVNDAAHKRFSKAVTDVTGGAAGLLSGPIQVASDLIANKSFNGNYTRDTGGGVGNLASRETAGYFAKEVAPPFGVATALRDKLGPNPQDLATLTLDLLGVKSAPLSKTDDLDRWLLAHPQPEAPQAQTWADLKQAAPAAARGLELGDPEVRGILADHAREADPSADRVRRQQVYDQEVLRDGLLKQGVLDPGTWRDQVRQDGIRAGAVADYKELLNPDLAKQAEPKNENERALQGYYNAINKLTDSATGLPVQQADDDGHDPVDAYLEGLPDAQRQWILDNVHINASPLTKQYFAFLQEKRDLGWETLYARYPSVVADLPPGVTAIYEAYLAAPNKQAWFDSKPGPAQPVYRQLVNDVSSRVSALQDAYRSTHKGFDDNWSLFYGGVGFTPETQLRDAQRRISRGESPVRALHSGAQAISSTDVAALAAAGIRDLETLARQNPADLPGNAERWQWVEQARKILEAAK